MATTAAASIPVSLAPLPRHLRALSSQPQPFFRGVGVLEEGTIVVTRPWSELCSHIHHLQVPKWQLIKRLVSTLFQFSLYDRVLLLRPEAIYHSLKGRLEVINSTGKMPDPTSPWMLPRVYFSDGDLKSIKEQFPFLLENALYLRANVSPSFAASENSFFRRHPDVNTPSFGALRVRFHLSNYSEISADTVSAYFLKVWGIKLTDKESGNRVSDLVRSLYLSSRELSKLYYFNPVSGTR